MKITSRSIPLLLFSYYNRTMQRILTFQSNETESMRVDSFLLRQNLPRCSVKLLKKLQNHIYVNGKEVYVIERVNPGDTVTVEFHEEIKDEDRLIPTDLPLDIVYEDEDILIVNKSADMSVHPVRTNLENTLANAVTYYYSARGQNDFVFRCLNRLDRYTSGLTLIAKNALSAQILSEDMQNRRIHRTYLGIAEGKLSEPIGIIDAPIARETEEEIRRIVDFTRGQTAITEYEVLDYNAEANVSLLRFQLKTGRTHQIRVHMNYLGYPLIGDILYNPENHLMERSALHAAMLEFTHPITRVAMVIKKDMPSDMSFFFPKFHF